MNNQKEMQDLKDRQLKEIKTIISNSVDREVELIKQVAKYLYENDYIDIEFYEDEDELGRKREAVSVGKVFEDVRAQDFLQAEVELLALDHSKELEEIEDAKRSATYGY